MMPSSSTSSSWLLLLLLNGAAIVVSAASSSSLSYGVDCSFPMHHKDGYFFQNRSQANSCPPELNHRTDFFIDYMNGCYEHYGKQRCEAADFDRMKRNRDQPKSMVNFTDTGFKHISGSPQLLQLLTDFWNYNHNKSVREFWPRADIHTNHWSVPTEMVSIYDESLIGATEEFRTAILQAAKPIIEEWTGMRQSNTSVYGVRIYRDGAVLSPHCDRLPLVSSAIVNVAQDVDEDWPLEVYGRDGKAYNVTMKPGDVVLYESGSLIHGRPYPLKGRYYANIFIHFEPIGFMNGDEFVNPHDPDLPPYLVPDSPSAIIHKEWLAEEEDEEEEEEDDQPPITGANLAAAEGDMEALRKFARDDPQSLHTPDHNGWQPIHEAVRSGHVEAFQFLLHNGANVRARANDGQTSPWNLAVAFHGETSRLATLINNAEKAGARMLRGMASTEIHDEA